MSPLRVGAVAIGLLLLFSAGGSLFAQQAPPPDQNWPQQQNPQDDQSSPQYPPAQAPDYGQQPSPQNPYAQSPDSQQAYPEPGQSSPQQGNGYESQPAPAQALNAAQLEQLVAPIALYPDALVAQILAASTYPAQVVQADRWRQMQGYASPEQIAAGADAQTWDPAVKALTAFPQILAQMDRSLQWTTALGNAYYNQPQDVLEAVQVMRQRAQAAGNLQTTPQEIVREDQGNIDIEPANPQIVYVPYYNPWAVYGAPVAPYPGFSLLGAIGSFLGSSLMRYGFGVAMTAFTHTPWGWLAWGLNWLSHAVLFHQSNYYSHSATVADWGFRHSGFHAFSERDIVARRNGYYRWSGDHGWHGGGYSSREPGYFHSPDRYAGNRWNDNRGFHSFGNGYSQPPLAYNREPARPRQDSRGFASGFDRGRGESYSRESRPAYGGSLRAYGAPPSGYARGGFGERSSEPFTGREFGRSSKPPHSGGFHPFGGGHAQKAPRNERSRNFRPVHESRAPKFHSQKSFGGGHFHGGGGHFSSHGGGGKHHR